MAVLVLHIIFVVVQHQFLSNSIPLRNRMLQGGARGLEVVVGLHEVIGSSMTTLRPLEPKIPDLRSTLVHDPAPKNALDPTSAEFAENERFSTLKSGKTRF